MIIAITERNLDLIIDGLVHRQEDLTDIQAFSVNPLAVKLRIKELSKLTDTLRSVRDAKN